MHLGPYPVEHLARQATLPPVQVGRETGRARPTTGLGGIAREYTKAFFDADTIPVASEKVSLPPTGDLTDEIKATCHFLDATAVGVCAVTDGPEDCNRAVLILVEPGRAPETANAASAWLDGKIVDFANLRCTEIAVVLAGYIRQLGHQAHLFYDHGSTNRLIDLAAAAGIGRRKGSQLEVPFIGPIYALSAVLTSLPLAVDKPLATNGSLVSTSLKLRRFFGFGGVQSTSHKHMLHRRATHLGNYPMERIRRRSTPTTLILEDEVPRVPKRAGFFARAGHGDLGAKTQRERDRFATKHPLAFAMSPLMHVMVPIQDGTVGSVKTDGTKSAATNTKAVKSLAYMLGADMVGVGEAVSYAWYSHDAEGKPLPVRHKHAIVMMIDQGYDTSEGSSGDDWISGSQSMRAYLRGAEIAGVLAAQLRSLGHSARAHTNRESDVLHLPLILHAGLGELSRIGELVLNPFLGPRSKSVVVTTDMPLELDQPIDFGLQDFCAKCTKCARECPCNAISYKNKVIFNGYEMWKPDVERCTRYRVTNPKGSSCGRCMKVCPFANEGLISHRMFLWLAVHVPMTRRLIIKLDDVLKNGARNPVKRWWRDLTRTPTGSVQPATGTNERDLKDGVRSTVAAAQDIAYYPADAMPPADASEAWPINRAKALQMQREMETPAQALARRKRID